MASSRSAVPAGLVSRIGYLLNRPAAKIRDMAQKCLKPLGIIPPHFGVMATLESEGPMTQRALGTLLKVDPTTMVWLIDDLEKAKLVRRGRHPKDRRAYLVELSPSGHSVYKRASTMLDRLDQEFLAPLSSSERNDLRRLLLKLFEHMPVQGISPALFTKKTK